MCAGERVYGHAMPSDACPVSFGLTLYHCIEHLSSQVVLPQERSHVCLIVNYSAMIFLYIYYDLLVKKEYVIQIKRFIGFDFSTHFRGRH